MAAKGRKRRTPKIVAAVLLAVCMVFLLQRLFMPKYVGDVTEGGQVAEYYHEAMDHDVVFIGDCEVYENISPVVLWENYGINSYIRGTPQQTVWQSCYLLEEVLSYETPKVVVWNVLAMEYDEPQSEVYNRMTLDYMRWSPIKVKSVLASMTREEHFVEYLFPILRYHTRWKELGAEDLRYFWSRPDSTYNGYYMRADVRPMGELPEPKVLADYRFGDNAWEYLDRMRLLCEERGVELVLIKAPVPYPYWYEEWEIQIQEYAAAHGLKYYNLLEQAQEIGLDYHTDTYDGGLHLNVSGAEKTADYFGQILASQCGLASRRGERDLEEAWEEKRRKYEAEKLRQLEK